MRQCYMSLYGYETKFIDQQWTKIPTGCVADYNIAIENSNEILINNIIQWSEVTISAKDEVPKNSYNTVQKYIKQFNEKLEEYTTTDKETGEEIYRFFPLLDHIGAMKEAKIQTKSSTSASSR